MWASYFFDLWNMVTSVFSFPTLLARATYMSYGGGGQEVKRISVNPLFSVVVGEGRGPIFWFILLVTTYYLYTHHVYFFHLLHIRDFEKFSMSSLLILFYVIL
jgi:hypothetical protein